MNKANPDFLPVQLQQITFCSPEPIEAINIPKLIMKVRREYYEVTS